MTILLILLIALLISCMMAVMFKDLLMSAIALSVASIALTLMLFEFSAPWAAVFELSVCAGLITVLFISTVSLVRKEEQFLSEDRLRFFAMPFFLAVFGLAFWLFSEPLTKALVPAYAKYPYITVGDWLWSFRWFDLLGQLCIFVAGVLAVNAFLKGKKNV